MLAVHKLAPQLPDLQRRLTGRTWDPRHFMSPHTGAVLINHAANVSQKDKMDLLDRVKLLIKKNRLSS